MKNKKIALIELQKLDALPTKRLLMRLKRLQQCEDSVTLSDRDINEHTGPGFIEFKDSPEWIAEFTYVKALLSEREHIVKKTPS